MFCRKAAIKFLIKLSVIYSCAVEREIQPKKKVPRGDKKRITSMNNRNCRWSRLFRAERWGKKCKGKKDGITIIKKFKELLEGEDRKIIHNVGKQGELLKKREESGEFFSRASLSRSNIYFKLRLHKFLCNFPILNKSILASSYFKSNFKLNTNVCKANVDIFGEKK